MAEKQGITSLKITGQHSRRLTPTTWTPGVDDDLDDDDDDDEEYENDQEDQEDEEYDEQVEQEEMDKLLNKGREQNNPREEEHKIVFNEEDKNNDEDENGEDDDEDKDKQEETEEQRYLMREQKEPEQMTYMQSGAEKAHCLMGIEGVKEEVEYNPEKAMIIAFVMANLNHKATVGGYHFYQQYTLIRGKKKFGEQGV